MLKKTFAAAMTTAVLLSCGAAMADVKPVGPNWAFSEEVIKLLKTKNGYEVIREIKADDAQGGIWKGEGIKSANGVVYEFITDSKGNLKSEKPD